MIPDAHRYLEHLCDTLAAPTTATHEGTGGMRAMCGSTADVTDAGMEPFGIGALLRLSPTRTKLVMRELLAHGLLGIGVAPGEDGRNELRVTATRETARWYARVLRSRAAARRYGMTFGTSTSGGAMRGKGPHPRASAKGNGGGVQPHTISNHTTQG